MIPVTVRLSNPSVDRHITSQLSGLSWRSVAPGGYASATFSLYRPIDVNDPSLAPFTRVYVYDGRDGATLWEGRLQMTGRSASDQGQIWALTAIGPSAHALDQVAPLIYIDQLLDSWQRSNIEISMSPSTTVAVGNQPDNSAVNAVVVGFPDGVPVFTGSKVAALYDRFVGSGMEIAGVGFNWDSGLGLTTTFAVELVVGTAPTYVTIPFTANPNTTGGSYLGWVITDFNGATDIAALRLTRTAAGGAGTSVGDAYWVAFNSIRVIGRRMSKDGVLLPGSAHTVSSINVTASWVVQDLLGRMLPQYDGANAFINAADTVSINQLAYDDPVTPSQVLEDLMKLEPATYWAAWESNAAGKYRFEWNNWPTEPRYEATVEDGFESPAPSFELYNKVRVRYRDPRGRVRTITRSQTIELLDNAGIVREWFEDLSDEAGSSTNALQFAINFLADHRAATSAGTLTVARPILDTEYGRWVQPWQIAPGEVIRVRGIEAPQGAMTGAPTRDGITTFRIVSVEVQSEGIATLELDMYTRSESRALAEVAMRRLRR